MLDLDLTAAEAAKFIRNHKGKIYVDVVAFGGNDILRIAAEKKDLIQNLEWAGESDGIWIFEDDAGCLVLGSSSVT